MLDNYVQQTTFKMHFFFLGAVRVNLSYGSFMQTKHLCVLIHIRTKGEVGAPFNRVKPSSKIFLLTVPRRCYFCGSFMLFLSCFVMFHARLFVDALWSPAGKRLTSWLSFVMSNCDVVDFPLVPWVRCGA